MKFSQSLYFSSAFYFSLLHGSLYYGHVRCQHSGNLGEGYVGTVLFCNFSVRLKLLQSGISKLLELLSNRATV